MSADLLALVAAMPMPETDVSWEDSRDQWGYVAYSNAYSDDVIRSERLKAAQLVLAQGEPALSSDQQYWLSIRAKVVQALADDGLEICSDKDRVWLHKKGGALANAAPAAQAPGLAQGEPVAASEFCCEHAWKAAKQAAWLDVQRTRCGCDHNESCLKCWPAEFREGGKFHRYTAPAIASAEAAAKGAA